MLTKKFNKFCANYHFWNSLAEYFIGFEELLKPNKFLSYDDRKTLFEIHSSLFKCYKLAKEKNEFYSNKVKSLV